MDTDLGDVRGVGEPNDRAQRGAVLAKVEQRDGLGAAIAFTVREGRWGMAVAAGSLFEPARLERSTGAAEMTTRWVGGEVFAAISPSESRFCARVSLGSSAVITALHGVAAPPAIAYDDLLVTAAPALQLDLGYALLTGLRLEGATTPFAPLRSEAIVFDGQQVGTYGAMLATGSLGLDAVIP